MLRELISMNGYGFFVWSTICLACFILLILFISSKRELSKKIKIINQYNKDVI